jgi:predicted nucleotidyltransferase
MATFDLDESRAALEAYFAAQEDVELAYLYGSQARGQENRFSDVDIAVLLRGEPDAERCFEARLRLIGDLVEILRMEELDVAVLNQAPASLRYRVLKEGLRLYCRDHDRWIAFRLQTVNEYLDFKPFLERHTRALLEKARKGELLDGYDPHRGALERYRQKRERLKGTPTPEP